MNSFEEQTQKYIDQMLADLGLENLQGKDKQDMVKMLTNRFSEVVFNTTVRLLPEDLKIKYIQAAKDPTQNEKQIIEITSQVPELAEGIEAALLYEYEAIKQLMAK